MILKVFKLDPLTAVAAARLGCVAVLLRIPFELYRQFWLAVGHLTVAGCVFGCLGLLALPVVAFLWLIFG